MGHGDSGSGEGWTFRRGGSRPPAGGIRRCVGLVILLGTLGLAPVVVSAPPAVRYREGRVLIQPKAGLAAGAIEGCHRDRGSRVLRAFPAMGGCQVVEFDRGRSVDAQIEAYRASGLVDWAEPDYLVHTCRVPSDPAFANGSQWHLENPGGNGGLADADIDASEGWDVLSEAPEVVVAVVDSGVRYTHEDLAANLWRNPGEIAGNGIDDDHNGYVDDVFGINAAAETGDPLDDVGHGTHIAGILGAVGDNGLGVAGVAWRVRIMACKFITASGEGATSDAIQGLDYARLMGARIINCSWGGAANSTALRLAFQRLRDAGVLVTVAAGNDGLDMGAQPQYPASYAFENMLTVAATTASDGLADFSNYGSTVAKLGAPGVAISSTWFTSDHAYASQTGTSMAAPVVAGVLALMTARFPSETAVQLVERILAATDPLPALAGRCVSGGRVNLERALRDRPFADFAASAWQGTPPFGVQFTNTTRGTFEGASWDFGDGTTSTEDSPAHVFATEGSHSVALTVVGADGVISTKTRTVSVVGNYRIEPGTFAWVDPSSMRALALTDNGVSGEQAIGFPFRYFGQDYESVYVGANGVLGFSTAGLAVTANADLPLVSVPNAMVCPYWDNLNPGLGGSVRVGTVGVAPARRFVASWVGVPLNTGGALLSFQAILEEGTGIVRFQYLEVQPANSRGAGRRATVGLENQTGTVAAKVLTDGVPVLLGNSQTVVFVPQFGTGQSGNQTPDPPVVLLLTRGPSGSWLVQVTGPPNRTCVIESSATLQTWESESELTLSADGTGTYGGLAPADGEGARFVRARVVP